MDFLLSAHALHNRLRCKLKLLSRIRRVWFHRTRRLQYTNYAALRSRTGQLLAYPRTHIHRTQVSRLSNKPDNGDLKRLRPPSKLKLLDITQPLTYKFLSGLSRTAL